MRNNLKEPICLEDAIKEIEEYLSHLGSAEKQHRGKTRAKQAWKVIKQAIK
jgi:hypothetical protein